MLTLIPLMVGWSDSTVAQAASNGAMPATASAPAGQDFRAEDVTSIEQVVVTARKFSEPLQSTPVTVSAFTANDIAAHQITGIIDLMHATPGFYVAAAGSDNSDAILNMRGLGENNTTLNLDPAVGVYVDGVYQGAVGINLRNADDVEQIEVLKGPQGTLYGRNTVGGAINTSHILPSFDGVSGWVRGGTGNYGEYDGAGVLNLPLVDHTVALRLVVGDLGHRGYGTNVTTGQELQNERTQNFLATLRIEPTDKLQLLVRGSYEHTTSGGIGARPLLLLPGSPAAAEIAAEVAGIPTGLAAFGIKGPAAAQAANAIAQNAFASQLQSHFYDASLGYPQQNMGRIATSSVTATYQFNPDLSLKSITAYRVAARDASQDADATAFNILASYQDQVARQLTEELQLTGKAWDNTLKYVVGAFYYKLHAEDDLISSTFAELGPVLHIPSPSASLDGDRTKSNAVFGQMTYALTSKWNVTGGLRWTGETKELLANNSSGTTCDVPGVGPGQTCLGRYSNSFNNVSYLASTDYAIADDILLYVDTSRGFKSGGQQQRSPGLPPFAAERVTEYEAGIKSEYFAHRLRVNLAVYHEDISDLQIGENVVLIPGTNPVFLVTSAGQAKVDGVELDLKAVPIENLTVDLSGAYTLPRYQRYTDAILGDLSHEDFLLPKLNYTVSGEYRAPLSIGDLRMQLDWHWQSEVNSHQPSNAPDLDRLASYGLLNGRLALEIRPENLEVALWGKNLADKEYYVQIFDFTGSALQRSIGLLDAFPGMPRTFGIELTKHF
jgi:iron complex outermembrane receptor protein